MAIYDAYKQGKVNDLRIFTAGVVTADGNTYLVNINDIDAFISFGDKYFKSESDMEKMENEYIGIFDNNVPAYQKIVLMDVLKDAGLYIFEGDINNFSDWDRQEVSPAGVPENTDCND